MLEEFKTFIRRGNVPDLAVAVVIGGAFGAIADSPVTDISMPPLGPIRGQVNFGDLFLGLNGQTYGSPKAAQDAGAPTLNYGLFLRSAIGLLIVAFAIFPMVRSVDRLQRQQPAPPVAPMTRDCPYCLSDIPLKATRCSRCTSEVGTA